MSAIVTVAVCLINVGQVEPLPHIDSWTQELRAPARIAVAPDDSVFVTDPQNRQIIRFDPLGSVTDQYPVPEGPIGIAAHPDGRIFVSLRDEPKVAIYDATFNRVAYLGEDEPLVSFSGPTDVEIAANTGRVYVVDAEGDRVYGFESDGSLALVLGSRGNWPGQFIYPSAITIDEPRNRIIVADHDKNRLHVFTTGGVFLQQFGDRLISMGGGLEGWMPRPLGLTVDAEGFIYLTDSLMGTVRMLDLMGTDLGKVVEYGYAPGELRTPCDLALSNDESRLYVVSTGSSRVEIYAANADGRALVASTGEPAWPLSEAAETMPDIPTETRNTRETRWDGPHIVEDRPDLCKPCHGIVGQPGGHAGSVEGQSALCLSCHSAGGRALNAPIHERDIANPFGTNVNAVEGQGRSHAWGVPAVNPLADAVGPSPGNPMSWYLDPDGNIKCATCHNQHNTDYGSLYLRVSNDGDAMCKECHAPRDLEPGEGGSHPVGFPYPEGEDEYPIGSALGPLFIKDGMIECLTCHAPHGADSGGANEGNGDGMLLRDLNDETLCRYCHTEHMIHNVSGDWQPTCRDCHDVHDANNENVTLIAQEVDGTPVVFVGDDHGCDGEGDFIHSVCDPVSYDGICEVCHTTTEFHRNVADGDHAHSANARCTDCHLHRIGFLASCIDCHGEPPDGSVSPNQAGSHAAHFSAISGPRITECDTCHTPEDVATHDNGVINFASGVDANFDGTIDLSETDVCDVCHSAGGLYDGVNDPVIGAKANWHAGVYDGDLLEPDKLNWCLGCHDDAPAEVNEIAAPTLAGVAGDNEPWGYNVAGHGQSDIGCTDCHDPALPHTDGVAKTFSERFPLSPGGLPKPPEEREIDRESYNHGYRLRTVDGGPALAVPRDAGSYTPDDFRLCFSCHNEVSMLGVPSDYGTFSSPPSYLQLPAGVAWTNYRNEYEWGFFSYVYGGKPANIHWNHSASTTAAWDIDHDENMRDSRLSCVTCHNPHGARRTDGQPTFARTMADLEITFDVYDDGVTEREYGFIGSGAYLEPGGDLHCQPCHPFFGPGLDPDDPNYTGEHTRFYREWLDVGTGWLDGGSRDGKANRDSGSRSPEGQ